MPTPNYIHHGDNFGAGVLTPDIMLDPIVVPYMADHRSSILMQYNMYACPLFANFNTMRRHRLLIADDAGSNGL